MTLFLAIPAVAAAACAGAPPLAYSTAVALAELAVTLDDAGLDPTVADACLWDSARPAPVEVPAWAERVELAVTLADHDLLCAARGRVRDELRPLGRAARGLPEFIVDDGQGRSPRFEATATLERVDALVTTRCDPGWEPPVLDGD